MATRGGYGLTRLLDAQPVGLGFGQVLADVALGVHDHGPTGRLVSDQVAVERQAAELVLVEVHGAAPQASFRNMDWRSASS